MSKTKFVDEANKVIAEVIEALGNKSGSVKITTDDKTGEVVKSNIDLDLAKKLWNAVGVLEQHDANEHDAQCKHKCARNANISAPIMSMSKITICQHTTSCHPFSVTAKNLQKLLLRWQSITTGKMKKNQKPNLTTRFQSMTSFHVCLAIT